MRPQAPCPRPRSPDFSWSSARPGERPAQRLSASVRSRPGSCPPQLHHLHLARACPARWTTRPPCRRRAEHREVASASARDRTEASCRRGRTSTVIPSTPGERGSAAPQRRAVQPQLDAFPAGRHALVRADHLRPIAFPRGARRPGHAMLVRTEAGSDRSARRSGLRESPARTLIPCQPIACPAPPTAAHEPGATGCEPDVESAARDCDTTSTAWSSRTRAGRSGRVACLGDRPPERPRRIRSRRHATQRAPAVLRVLDR